MFYFRVIAGLHKDGDKTYKKGDVVESNRDLTKLFRGKFVRTIKAETPLSDVATAPKLPQPSKAEDKGEKAKAKSSKSSAKKAEEEMIDVEAEIEEEAKIESEVEAEEAEAELEETATVDLSAYGKDVTDKFSIAKKNEYVVYKKGKFFNVIDPDDGEVLNTEKLLVDEVKDFIKAYLKGE